MRALLASTIGVACTAALALPLALPAGAAGTSGAAERPATRRAAPAEPLGGSTQSLRLVAPEAPARSADAGVRSLPRRDVRPFSMVGIVWDDPEQEFHGRAQVRIRSTGSDRWSDWRDLQTHSDDLPDKGADKDRLGGTAPLWVGDSDGVQVRTVPERNGDRAPAELPDGLRIELVDPGSDPDEASRGGQAAELTAAEAASSAVNAELAEIGATEIEPLAADVAPYGDASESEENRAGGGHVGPRPGIVIRRGWGANESWRERQFRYTSTVRTAFVHHSATGNSYSCKQAPSVLRGIYRYHVKSLKWRDIGYNFAVDKCGTVYEGRAGGVARPVMGAHTLGFNSNSMGIAVLGTYSGANPPKKALDGVAKLTAWKLGLFGRNAKGSVTVVSGGSNKHRKGARVKLKVISGHRDGFTTDCPGARLYDRLGTIRNTAGRLQGR